MTVFLLLFPCIGFTFVNAELDLCTEDILKPKICRDTEEYEAFRVPRPLPLTINPIVDIKDILAIDEDDKSMTVDIYIVMKWVDPQITYVGPEGTKLAKWARIGQETIKGIWAPQVSFLKVIDVKYIPYYGKNTLPYDFWLNKKDNQSQMIFYQAVQVKFACEFNFQNYPFDSHDCHLDFGLPQYTFNKTMVMGPIKFLGKDSKAIKLETEQEVPNKHLPYKFSLRSKESFPWYNFEYFTSFTGIIIKARRYSLGSLYGEFYGPTFVFAILSNISYLINPDIVPGRMGLLVTLYLISSNVYSSVSAPKKRGFSYIEVWIMGSQGTILLAIIEYGFILMWKKFEKKASSEVTPIVDKDEEKTWNNLSLNEKIKRVDIISIIISGMFFLLFNIIYWIHTSMI